MSQDNQPQTQSEVQQPQPQPQPQPESEVVAPSTQTKSTAQISREQRNMSEADKQKEIERINKVDSPGNRCSYCGESFDDQLKLGTHVVKEHAHENELRPGEAESEAGPEPVVIQDQQVQEQAQQAQQAQVPPV